MDARGIDQIVPRRPRSVAILGTLQILESLGLLGFGLMRTIQSGITFDVAEQTPEALLSTIVEVITSGLGILIISIPLFFIGIALLRMKSWAWLWAMTFQGFSLMVLLFEYVRHKPNYLAMAVGVILVYYLNQQEVQAVFRSRRR